jgi:hypothetical protein
VALARPGVLLRGVVLQLPLRGELLATQGTGQAVLLLVDRQVGPEARL